MKKLKVKLRAISADNGFTLIEILIAIALLAVIAAIVVPNLTGFLGRGQTESYKSDRNAIQAASDAYYTDPTTRSGGARQYPSYSGGGGTPATYAGPGGGYYISFGKLATTTFYLNDTPDSAGSGNATGSVVFSGSYWWYIDSNGRVRSSPAYSGVFP